jgi:hypothetical protein
MFSQKTVSFNLEIFTGIRLSFEITFEGRIQEEYLCPGY